MRLKKNTLKLMRIFFGALLIIKGVYAQDVTVIGSIKQTLHQSSMDSSSSNKKALHTKSDKIIQLMQIELSEETKNLLIKRTKEALAHKGQFTIASKNSDRLFLPNKIELGMNKVPVLDQGIHGTCVTFAVTGAIDALLAKGDYVSQLCNLQLGAYLELHGYGMSGWDGSYPISVINQIEQYGIVNTEKQRTQGCGRLTRYPTESYHSPFSFIDPKDYSSMSEFVFGQALNWSDVVQKNNPIKTLNSVKEALNSGDRLVFSVLLPRTDLGMAGAVGKHNTWFYKDSWVLTQEILNGVDNIKAAHAMIITGYDDDAVAVDNHREKHKGLLTLRNSWGSSVGDYGEFYMSYDYFKLLAYDVKRFSPSSI